MRYCIKKVLNAIIFLIKMHVECKYCQILFNYVVPIQVVFEKATTELKGIQFVELELQYGSVLRGASLDITATTLLLHPGSTLTLSGGGYTAMTGPGAGALVGVTCHVVVDKQLNTCIHLLFPCLKAFIFKKSYTHMLTFRSFPLKLISKLLIELKYDFAIFFHWFPWNRQTLLSNTM